MPLHFVSKSTHNNGGSLASSTMISKNFNYAVFKWVVIKDDFFEIGCRNLLWQNFGLEFLSLIVMLQGIAILVRAIQKLLNLLFQLTWIVMMRHEHDVLREWIVPTDDSLGLFNLITRVQEWILGFNFFYFCAFGPINYSYQRKLGVGVFKVDSVWK